MGSSSPGLGRRLLPRMAANKANSSRVGPWESSASLPWVGVRGGRPGKSPLAGFVLAQGHPPACTWAEAEGRALAVRSSGKGASGRCVVHLFSVVILPCLYSSSSPQAFSYCSISQGFFHVVLQSWPAPPLPRFFSPIPTGIKYKLLAGHHGIPYMPSIEAVEVGDLE